MIEIQALRDRKEEIVQRLQIRGLENVSDQIDHILSMDGEKRKVIHKMEQLRHDMNLVSKSIGQLMGAGKKEEAEAAKQKTVSIKEEVKFFESSLEKINHEMHSILVTLPNAPDLEVPPGKTPEDNKTVFESGDMPKLVANAKPHWDLCKELNIISWDLGAKITGAGFPVYIGKGAKLQRALVRFFLDEADKAGYEEIQPPLLINEDSGFGTGQLPDKEGQMYHAVADDLYLIPTAEVPITNLYRNVSIKEADLPVKNCGYTPCFRREAGSYGKDVRGLNRLHQFDKVEIVQITTSENSYQLLGEMVDHVKGLLEKLELPYRVLLLCGGDIGFTAAKTYDLEVYCAAQDRWLEVSSVSNFESFQSNRLKLRIKGGNKKNQLAHTLNGSALALPRIYASIIENNQQEDGTIKIPEVLRPYTGFDYIGK